MGDGLKEACGLCAVYGHESAAYNVFLGLQNLQHRGQESCGIVSSDGKQIFSRIRMGLVAENFDKKHFLANGNDNVLHGNIASGHVRYSTTGNSDISNAQPLQLNTKYGELVISHNGNITNAIATKNKLVQTGAIFKTTTDSEVVGHLIARSQSPTLAGAIMEALKQLEGAFCFTFMTKNELYAARDPNGFRPLSIGRLGNSVLIVSETCALDVINAKYERDVEPGELIVITQESWPGEPNYRGVRFASKVTQSFCLFELIYFARPDSVVRGIPVAQVRLELGKALAREYPVDADLVFPVPDSGNYAAIGFSQQSGIPYLPAYVRNHYVGRTFIEPNQQDRETQVDLKLNVIRPFVAGKRVVVVDDSVVRGNTARRRVTQLKELGATAVHVRISCPPLKNPCYYGIDFPTKKELIAANKSIEEIKAFVGADSLGYLSMETSLNVAASMSQGFCTACWTGKYPTKITDVSLNLLTKKT